MTTTPDNTATFDEIAAAFADEPRCEIRVGYHDSVCRRPAGYHVVCHECGRGLICKAHLERFLRQVEGNDCARCNHCGREFASINDAVRITAI